MGHVAVLAFFLLVAAAAAAAAAISLIPFILQGSNFFLEVQDGLEHGGLRLVCWFCIGGFGHGLVD